jgi:hypothetical protein
MDLPRPIEFLVAAPGGPAAQLVAARPLLYLVVAGVCLVLALRLMKRALAPIGLLVRPVAAAVLAALAIGTALAFLTAAAVSGR